MFYGVICGVMTLSFNVRVILLISVDTVMTNLLTVSGFIPHAFEVIKVTLSLWFYTLRL
jgi:hypothetical protein